MSTTNYSITLQTIHVSTKKPLGGLRIEVRDKDRVGNDDFLAEGITDKAGNAKIQFAPEQFTEVSGDLRTPDLYFKVYRGDKLVADTEGQVMWNIKKKTAKITIAVNEESFVANPTSYNITVQTVDISTRKPLGNLRIEVWDKDRVGNDDFLAEGITDKAGNAKIQFASEQFTEVSGDRSTPDLYFKVYRGDKLVADTEGQVMWNIRKTTSKITIAVNLSGDDQETPEEKIFSVSGTVFLANGRTASGVTVKVFHQGLSADAVLGTVETNPHGAYQLIYTPAPKGTHIFIRVYDPTDESQLLGESAVTYFAKEETVIDLQLLAGKEAGLTLFETIAQLFLPEVQKLRPDTLTDKQLVLLSRTIGISFDVLTQYRQAFILHATHTQLPPIFFFALITSGISVEENQWKIESVAVISHALQEAQRNYFIPEIPVQTLEAMLQAFQAIRARHHMEDALLANHTNLQSLLDTSGVPAASQQKIAALYADHSQRPDIFWTSLLKDQELAPQAEKLKRSFSFHRLTLGNIPLTKKLFADNSISSLHSMAAWDSETWKTKLSHQDIVNAIPAQFPGDTPESRKTAYARYLSSLTGFLYPTEAVAGRIQLDGQMDKNSKLRFRKFFDANPSFRIETHSVDAYLTEHSGVLDPIEDGQAFGQQLYHLSQQFALAPPNDKYAGIRRLANMNIYSASGVANMGRKKFTDNFKEQGGQEEEAFFIYNTAGIITSQTQLLKLNYGYDTNVLPYVIGAAVKDDEMWQQLFGAEDYCGCRHCRSLYGPAAYLADLLAFLNERGGYPDETVVEVLEKRRPDIANILLNCTNAETAMPYIDLVNEILENAIVTAPDFKYQTTGESDDLYVLPENLNEEAYITLSQAVYPWTLPFDLFTETGRLFLAHAGIRHDELIRLFSLPADVAGARYIDAVLELLPVDRMLITAVGNNYKEGEWWGEGFPTGGEILVATVLERSGLRYAEMQELRRTKFFNPLNEIQINEKNNCTIEEATFSRLNREDRRKFLQFVRLQKKLKLTVRETDHLLFALGLSEEITSDALKVAAQLMLVRRRMSLPVGQILSWWGKMATAHPGDEETHQELYERVFLNKTIQQEWKKSGPDQPDAPFQAFLLANAGTELLKEVDINVPENFSYLAAVLETSADELNFMISRINSHKLDLAELSKLYGMKSMSIAFRCSVQELYTLIELSGINPFMPAFTVRFMDVLELIRKNNWKISELGFVLRHDHADEFTWTRDKYRTTISDLHTLVRDAGDETDVHILVTHRLATLVELSPAVAALLLLPAENDSAYLHVPGQSSTPLLNAIIKILRDESFPLEEETESDLVNGLILLQKAAWVIRKFGFPDNYLEKWLVKTQTEFLNLDALPVHEGNNGPVLWDKIVDLLVIRTLHKSVITDAITLLDPPSKEKIVEAFETDISEQQVVLKFLMQRSDVVTVASQARFVYDVCVARKTLGIRIADYVTPVNAPANTIVSLSLARPQFDASLARRIEAVAKSKYNLAQWRPVATSLRDRLRVRQRDVLSSYLVANRDNGVRSLDDLYAYYLVDVEMGSCMKTSRIRLALSSVQLFVQRCLMGLEPEVDLSMITDEAKAEWEEWNWRKNYRVWEANRKIFLYPENWLEPEWRDDKTPFFEELENELQQNELSSEIAEEAFLNYLQKVDTVSNLEIVAMCKSNEENVYTIFGRTYSDPKTIYQRDYISSPQHFTPWKKVELAIEGDHFVPVVHQNRLFLFWPLFKEQVQRTLPQAPADSEDESSSAIPAPSPKYWRLQLAWSEYRNENWSPKQVSRDFFDDTSGIVPNETGTDYESLTALRDNTFVMIQPGDELASITFLRLYRREGSGVVFQNSVICQFDFDTRSVTLQTAPAYMEVTKVSPTFSFGRRNQILIRNGGILETTINGIVVKSKNRQLEKIVPVYQVKNSKAEIAIDAPLIFSGNQASYIFQPQNEKYRIVGFSHVLSSKVVREIHQMGLETFMSHRSLNITNELSAHFDSTYRLIDGSKINNLPVVERIGFDIDDAHSQYNWEIFFHIPMLVATRLSQEQRYEEARDWFHYVFNPVSNSAGDVPERFWNFKPFLEYQGVTGIRELLESPEHSLSYSQFSSAVELWERNPFNPHSVARTRLIAYMKWVVMKYIDNLIEWADLLFRQDTMESLNEATQLYMLAWNILGRSPEELEGQKTEDKAFNNIRYHLDPLSNTFVDVIEERVASAYTRTEESRRQSYQEYAALPSSAEFTPASDFSQIDITPPSSIIGVADLYIMKTLYFCIPPNDKLLGYWKLLGDRFFKLRNCQNISGQVRMLPLYEPPIDPALLIRAGQAGLSISEALSMTSILNRPHYRFAFMIQKAIDYTNDVRALGNALLAAMEKQDAEELNLLRSGHEQTMLNAILQNRKLQVDEAQESLGVLHHSLNAAKKREEYYSNKQFMNAGETAQMILMAIVSRMQLASQAMSSLSTGEKAIPDFTFGGAGISSPVALTTTGGQQAGSVSDSAGDALSKMASVLNLAASEIGQIASYERRFEDWMHQADMASEEILQVEKQLLAAEIRVAIQENELQNHELQIKQAHEQNEMMVSKFTNKELYRWMIEQIKILYNQSYQAAVEIALKAEVSLTFELPALKDRSFIKFGYWDNLKEGLLSGEKLHHDLKQMEMAYIASNKRLFEITKTVSLAMVSAQNLVDLKNIGTCTFTIPETLFNLDFPKHAGKMRRIKAVSLSVPCVTGPYTGVNCILTATSEGMSSSVATSTGLNDTGIFQFNFADERYLPFEGMPVDSEWTIDMNPDQHAFDFGSISDVLLHIHYTVDPDLEAPVTTAARHTSDSNSGSLSLTRYISLRNEFADEWTRFKNNPLPNLEIPLTEKLFPYMFRQEALNTIGPVAAWTKTGDTYTELASTDANFVSPKVIVNGAALSSADDVLLAVKYTVTVN